MFNDKYGLSTAVLQRRKTMTRRLVGNHMTEDDIKAYLKGYKDVAYNLAPYKIGEVVAVAQPYKDLGYTKEWVEQHINPNPYAKWTDPFEKKYPSWTNKMFVCADFMPHQIRIADIKVERLQVISEEDVYREGFRKNFINNGWGNAAFHEETVLVYYDNLGLTKTIRSRYPKEAFAALIDKVSGKGTWERNPYVFAYSFELVY